MAMALPKEGHRPPCAAKRTPKSPLGRLAVVIALELVAGVSELASPQAPRPLVDNLNGDQAPHPGRAAPASG